MKPSFRLAKRTLQILLLFFVGKSFGQSSTDGIIQLYPENFHSDFLLQAAGTRRLPSDQKYSAIVQHQRYVGLLNGIYATRFTGFVRIKNRHQLGLLANTMKEGPYIGTVQGMLHYANSVNLSKTVLLSLGAGIGVAGLYYDGGTTGENGRAFVPDFSLDLALHTPSFFANVIIKQLSSPSLAPLGNTIELSRYFEGRSGKKFKLGPYWKLGIQGHAVYYPKLMTGTQNQWGAWLGMDYQKTLSIGLASYNVNSLILQASVSIPFDSKLALKIFGSYKSVLAANIFTAYSNSWEIGLELHEIVPK